MSTDASGTVSTQDEDLAPADGNIVSAADGEVEGEVACRTSIYPQRSGSDSTCTNISTETSQAHQDKSVAVNESNPPLIPLIVHDVDAPGNERAPSKGVDNATDGGTLLTCSMNGSGPQKVPQQQQYEAEGEEPEYFCRIGPCHLPWLHWLRDPRVVTFLLCLYSIVEGALVTGMCRSNYVFHAFS